MEEGRVIVEEKNEIKTEMRTRRRLVFIERRKQYTSCLPLHHSQHITSIGKKNDADEVETVVSMLASRGAV